MSYLHVAAGTLLLSLPAGFGVAAVADVLTPVALGEKWSDATPIIELLAMSGAVISFGANTNPIFMAVGRIAISSMFSALHIVLFLGLMLLWAPQDGARGAAMALLTATALTQFLPISYTLWYLRIPAMTYLESIWRPIVGVAVMFAAVRGWIGLFSPFDAFDSPVLLLLLLSAVLVGLIVYTLVVLLLWRLRGRPDGAEQIVIGKLLPILRDKLLRRGS